MSKVEVNGGKKNKGSLFKSRRYDGTTGADANFLGRITVTQDQYGGNLLFSMHIIFKSGFKSGDRLQFKFSQKKKALFIAKYPRYGTAVDSYPLVGWGNACFLYNTELAKSIIEFFEPKLSDRGSYAFTELKLIKKEEMVVKVTLDSMSGKKGQK